MEVDRYWILLAAALGALACNDLMGMEPSAVAAGGVGGASGAAAAAPSGAGGVAGGAGAGAGGVAAAGAAVSGQSGAGTGGASAAGGSAPLPDAAVPSDGSVDGGDAGVTDACDRICLVDVMSAYLDALTANDPAPLPLAPTLKFTENGVEQQLGSGFWQDATSYQMDTRQDFADPVTGQVGSHLVFEESSGMPVIYQVRLKVVARAISEIETMVVHRLGARNGFFNPEGMVPDPVFDQAIEPAQRVSREQLQAVVDKYFDALDGGDWADDLFDASVARYENGVRTATASSITLQSWNFDVVRRYLIFDEEYQMVFGMFPFTPADNALVVGELFKVMAGKIRMIQAVMAEMPAKAWD